MTEEMTQIDPYCVTVTEAPDTSAIIGFQVGLPGLCSLS